jgi:hypothetical protein
MVVCGGFCERLLDKDTLEQCGHPRPPLGQILYAANCFFAMAQRFFIAAEIAALPFALNFVFLGLVTLGSVDLGRPGPFLIDTFDSNALACSNLDISVSISAMMRFVSMMPLRIAIITKKEPSRLSLQFHFSTE